MIDLSRVANNLLAVLVIGVFFLIIYMSLKSKSRFKFKLKKIIGR